MVKQTRTKKQRNTFTVGAVTKEARTGDEYGRLLHGGLEWGAQLRLVGRDQPLADVVAAWQQLSEHTVTTVPTPVRATAVAAPTVTAVADVDDYVQIDLKLAIQVSSLLSEEPAPGTGYAAFTPVQRYHFLHWLENVTLTAPTAFRQLYLAQLECDLFDDAAHQRAAWLELLRLSDVPSWQMEEQLWRLLLLAFHLKASGEHGQDVRGPGAALAEWLSHHPALPPTLLGVAMGQLALWGAPLTVDLLAWLLAKWQVAETVPDDALLQLRLDYLSNTLGAEPLHHLLSQLDDGALSPQPWRTVHRNLRLRIVQPDLGRALLPLLREISTLARSVANESVDTEPVIADAVDASESGPSTGQERKAAARSKAKAQPDATKRPWQLVLEFGDSRSEYFNYALNQAKRMPGYLQIMDENRRMIHRVHFDKAEMRRFWSLWEYVQSWSSTQIYVNGKELQKWEIYPYSPYLR